MITYRVHPIQGCKIWIVVCAGVQRDGSLMHISLPARRFKTTLGMIFWGSVPNLWWEIFRCFIKLFHKPVTSFCWNPWAFLISVKPPALADQPLTSSCCCRPHSFLWALTLYTLTSVCIFSILFSIHFLRCWQREFVQQSRASPVGDHFLYSPGLNVWFRGDIVRRNYIPITVRD